MVVLADLTPDLPAVAAPLAPVVAPERAARQTLLTQIARLERQLSDAVVSGFPHTPVEHRVGTGDGPRLLDLGELEALRDRLAARLRSARAELARAAERETAARLHFEAMLADPRGHRFHQVTRADLGMPGCGAYQVRPRLGLVGMLMGWWHVKLSSGCPLAHRGAWPDGAPPRTRIRGAWDDAAASAGRPARPPRRPHVSAPRPRPASHRAPPRAARGSRRRPSRPGTRFR
ncbi:MAG TPA: hypothetical protein VD931_10520 [Baekduia sp.]|nr:hypothetical protein [Baekduia sp.]